MGLKLTTLLAYVFWHRPKDSGALAGYEAQLAAFHVDAAQPGDGAPFALWQRQMVLGPAPEHCLLTTGDELVRVA